MSQQYEDKHVALTPKTSAFESWTTCIFYNYKFSHSVHIAPTCQKSEVLFAGAQKEHLFDRSALRERYVNAKSRLFQKADDVVFKKGQSGGFSAEHGCTAFVMCSACTHGLSICSFSYSHFTSAGSAVEVEVLPLASSIENTHEIILNCSKHCRYN